MKRKRSPNPKSGQQRISLSIPHEQAMRLDEMVQRRGFHNRSQAVSAILEEALNRDALGDGDSVMAGTITLFLDVTKPGLLQKLKQIQREHIREVISSQDVFLEENNLMQVLIVQGRVDLLRQIRDRMLTCKGVSSGELTLTSKILPPVYERT